MFVRSPQYFHVHVTGLVRWIQWLVLAAGRRWNREKYLNVDEDTTEQENVQRREGNESESV